MPSTRGTVMYAEGSESRCLPKFGNIPLESIAGKSDGVNLSGPKLACYPVIHLSSEGLKWLE